MYLTSEGLINLQNVSYIFKGDRSQLSKNIAGFKISSILSLKRVNCLQAQILSLHVYKQPQPLDRVKDFVATGECGNICFKVELGAAKFLVYFTIFNIW